MRIPLACWEKEQKDVGARCRTATAAVTFKRPFLLALMSLPTPRAAPFPPDKCLMTLFFSPPRAPRT